MSGMRRAAGRIAGAVVLAAAVAVSVSSARGADEAAPSAGQVYPRPTLPEDPVVKVEGVVTLADAPLVRAEQAGAWTVRVADLPAGGASGVPGFLTSGQVYEFTWADGQTETYRVTEVRREGWVRADFLGPGPGGARWVNPAAARAIAETPQ